jgi:hypothetical protein
MTIRDYFLTILDCRFKRTEWKRKEESEYFEQRPWIVGSFAANEVFHLISLLCKLEI